jgi:hypothetical protein
MQPFAPVPRQLRDIDAELGRAVRTRARSLKEMADLWADIVALDDLIEDMLGHRVAMERALAARA